MNPLIEPIERALASDADAETKRAGALACQAILAALQAEPGKAIAVPGAPPATPNPLSGANADQLLDLLIAKLRSMVGESAPAAASPGPEPLRIPMIVLPPAK